MSIENTIEQYIMETMGMKATVHDLKIVEDKEDESMSEMEECWNCERMFMLDEIEHNRMCSECVDKTYAHCYFCCEYVKICSSNCEKCKCFVCKKTVCQNCMYLITHDKYVCSSCFEDEPEKWKEEKRIHSR